MPVAAEATPVSSSNLVCLDEYPKGKFPGHNDRGGNGLFVVSNGYGVDEFLKPNPENPAIDY